MTTLFILVLLIISVFLILFKQIKSGLLFLIMSILSFIAIGNGFLPALLLTRLQTPFVSLPKPTWKNKNAIVLLGAGIVKLPATSPANSSLLRTNPSLMAYSRINTTAQLYFDCIKSQRTCNIIISGGDPVKMGIPEAMVYQRDLLNLGVKNSDILLEPNSSNTFMNAKLTQVLIKKNHFDQIILVTAGAHLTRSILYFSHFGIDAKPALADYLITPMRVVPSGFNFAITDFAIHEYLGIAQFYLYNFLGLNKA